MFTAPVFQSVQFPAQDGQLRGLPGQSRLRGARLLPGGHSQVDTGPHQKVMITQLIITQPRQRIRITQHRHDDHVMFRRISLQEQNVTLEKPYQNGLASKFPEITLNASDIQVPAEPTLSCPVLTAVMPTSGAEDPEEQGGGGRRVRPECGDEHGQGGEEEGEGEGGGAPPATGRAGGRG